MHPARTAVAQVADSSTRDVARADGAGILCSRSWIWLHISAGKEASFESWEFAVVEDVLKNICWAFVQTDPPRVGFLLWI